MGGIHSSDSPGGPLLLGGFEIDVTRDTVGCLRGQTMQQFRAQSVRAGIVIGGDSHLYQFERQL